MAIFAIFFSPPSKVSSTPVSDTEPRDYLLFNKLKPTALPQLAAAGAARNVPRDECCPAPWLVTSPHTRAPAGPGPGVNKMVLCSPAQEEAWNTQ